MADHENSFSSLLEEKIVQPVKQKYSVIEKHCDDLEKKISQLKIWLLGVSLWTTLLTIFFICYTCYAKGK